MINHSDYSCDKCAREFSRHCKHCYHTVDKPPTRFKLKKKTGIQTPEFKKPTPPPPPPTSGSNAVKPSPVAIAHTDIGTIEIMCHYETPCGWCTKWDKKCDKKIGCEENPPRALMVHSNIWNDLQIPETAMKIITKEVEKGLSDVCNFMKENNNGT